MNEVKVPEGDEPDAYRNTEGEPQECWKCSGTGYYYGTCLICVGFGWFRSVKADRRLDTPPTQ